jgi:hypothetical protein
VQLLVLIDYNDQIESYWKEYFVYFCNCKYITNNFIKKHHWPTILWLLKSYGLTVSHALICNRTILKSLYHTNVQAWCSWHNFISLPIQQYNNLKTLCTEGCCTVLFFCCCVVLLFCCVVILLCCVVVFCVVLLFCYLLGRNCYPRTHIILSFWNITLKCCTYTTIFQV